VLLCALLAVLPSALVVLHAEGPAPGTHAELPHEHDGPGAAHDHDLCLVFGSSPPTPSRPQHFTPDRPDAPRPQQPVATRRPPAAGEISTRLPRAPPLPT
jgi:hypothetical protein